MDNIVKALVDALNKAAEAPCVNCGTITHNMRGTATGESYGPLIIVEPWCETCCPPGSPTPERKKVSPK